MEKAALLSDVEQEADYTLPQARPRSNPNSLKWFLTALVCSLGLNGLLMGLVWHQSQSEAAEPPTIYGGLTRDRTEPFYVKTDYTSPNETLQTQLWHDINIDAGIIALDDDWARARGLRTAQRFPWDASKGVYLLHGYHNLHCVKIIHIALDEYRTGQPQSRNSHHITHCLDALRRQVLCDADDTPRATERRAEVVSGLGQHRQCRSWEKLEAFAREHNACYKRPDHPEDGVPIIERFKHCPPDSPYAVNKDWKPVDAFLEGLPEESKGGLE